MPFIATAVLVASICVPKEECKIIQIAQFTTDSAQDFCEGTAGAINSVGDEVGSSLYFCVTPKMAKALFPEVRK